MAASVRALLRRYDPSELRLRDARNPGRLLLARSKSLADLLTCAQLYSFTSQDAIGGLFKGKLVPDQGRGEKLALSQLDAIPLRGTDGGKVGVSRPRECQCSLCSPLSAAHTKQRRVSTLVLLLFYFFQLFQPILRCCDCNRTLLSSSPHLPPSSACRFATTQTA